METVSAKQAFRSKGVKLHMLKFTAQSRAGGPLKKHGGTTLTRQSGDFKSQAAAAGVEEDPAALRRTKEDG